MPRDVWRVSIEKASENLASSMQVDRFDSIEGLLLQTLGEGQFGTNHWKLSPAKSLYYHLKPIIPRAVSRRLRRIHRIRTQADFPLHWPIETRYVRFQWEIASNLLDLTGQSKMQFVHFWPYGHRYALALTHDIETAEGQRNAGIVADLEEGLGFRSSFNFVPERYRLDRGLMKELSERGFEIGVHGLNHDGKLFRSKEEFLRRASRINEHLRKIGAVGFRAPLTHRHPEWMQELQIEYDLSFFDTDPYEPIPGGTMSIWPFDLGRFVELPYTLAQDYTLTAILKENSPRIWLQKIEFIEEYCGMALVNTHPDYLKEPATWNLYASFLKQMKVLGGYWHELPRTIAKWWQARASADSPSSLQGVSRGNIWKSERGLQIEPAEIHSSSP